MKMKFLEAFFILSEWQALRSLLESCQPKGIACYEEKSKKVVVAVILMFSYEIREKTGCFCLGFYKN